MKKLLAIILLFTLTLCLSACAKQEGLSKYVSDLRSNLYQGQSQSFTVKGGYGFKETPYQNDGKVGEKIYALTLKLVGEETNQASFTASIDYNGQTRAQTFKLSPVSHSLITTIEIEGFNLDEFDITISCGDKSETVTMRSIVPLDTISYEKALTCLQQSNPELIKAFSNADGELNAEIHARIIVKNDKAYWYIGFAGGNDLLKALLVDGATGEVLAIREII